MFWNKRRREKKPDSFSRLEKVIDIEGVTYYKFSDEYHTPLHRFNAIKECMVELSLGVSGPNLDTLIATAIAEMDASLENTTKGRFDAKRYAKARYLLTEIQERRKSLAPAELYLKLIALMLVRPGESLEEVDEEVLQEKIELFRKAAAGKYRDFFFALKLSELSDLCRLSNEELMQLFKAAALHVKALMSQATTSAPSSSPDGKAS